MELGACTANDGAIPAERTQPIPDTLIAALENLAHAPDAGAVLGQFDNQDVVAFAPRLALVLMTARELCDVVHIALDVRVYGRLRPAQPLGDFPDTPTLATHCVEQCQFIGCPLATSSRCRASLG